MQRARRAGLRTIAQMVGAPCFAALRRERRAPRDARAGAAARIVMPHMPHASFEPSKPAVRRVRGDSGGIRPMAQRFFSGSGITPLTGAMPAGSGGR